MDELFSLSLIDAVRRLSSGEITSEAYTRSLLSRIDMLEPRVQAFQFLDKERALELAREADRRLQCRAHTRLAAWRSRRREGHHRRARCGDRHGIADLQSLRAGDERGGRGPIARRRRAGARQGGDHGVRIPGSEQDAQPWNASIRRADRRAGRRLRSLPGSYRRRSGRRPTAR